MSEQISVVVVDDEAAAREELKYLLGRLPGVEVVGEAADGESALALLAQARPHLAVLDVRMPAPDGLEVARRLPDVSPGTRVVFATAYDEHAVEAFDVAAADYLLKPFDEARVARAVARVRASPAGEEAAAPPRLKVERRRHTYLLDPAEVLWIGTDAGVVVVVADDGTRYGCDLTLRDLETLLSPWGFFRCHREVIVRLSRIGEVAPAASGTCRVVLGDAGRTELPVARNRVRDLKRLLGL